MAGELPRLSPKFEGARFEKHSIPVELLADLAAYRDLVKDVAREIYLKANPNRKRVPRAFELAFKLSLKKVADGSAVAELVNDVAVDEEQLGEILEFSEFFATAKTLVDDTIRSVIDEKGGLPKGFPEKLLPNFGKIGRHLKHGELIDFGFGTANSAKYTDDVRKTLVLWASNEVESDLDIIGKVTGVHNDPEDRFDVKSEEGKTVSGPYSIAHEEILLEAFRKTENYSVRVKGSGIFNKQGRVVRIAEASEIEILDENDIKLLSSIKRITLMEALVPGWCGKGSTNPPKGASGWAIEILKSLYEEFDLPPPAVFPIPTGGIQFEWTIPGGSIDVRLDFLTKYAVIAAFSRDRDFEETLLIDQPVKIAYLAKILGRKEFLGTT